MERKDFLKLLAITPVLTQAMNLQSLKKISENLPNTDSMPLLFVGHGNPMNALEENEFTKGWKRVAADITLPKAILCISAHWETKGTWITAMEKPRTIHDFGGFPQKLFDVEYPAPGSPLLAAEIKKLIHTPEIGLDQSWGLDHGSWSVIKVMYPEAKIPVLQMSIDYNKPALYHYELASQLNELRKKGVLIIGSGNMVHNLGMVDWQNPNKGYDWALEANEGFKKMILQNDIKNLTSVEKISSAFQLSIPTNEHYLPLLYVLGFKYPEEKVTFFNDKCIMGSLSMTSVMING